MEIRNIQIKPYENSIPAGMKFEIEIAYTKYREMITGLNGWLETDDGKRVSPIYEDFQPQSSHGLLGKSCELGARGSLWDNNFKEEIYRTTVITLLDKKALNWIEERRMRNEKRDVKLILNLTVKVLESKANISHLHPRAPEEIGLTPKISSSGREKEARIMVYAYDPHFNTNYTNCWILSGDNNPIFLSAREYFFPPKEIIIPSK